MMRSLPLAALSLTLGFFFVFIGLLKITPKVNPEMHRYLVRSADGLIEKRMFFFKVFKKFFKQQTEFGRYNKDAFPLYKITGWKPYAKNYRLTVGILEVLCGAILVLIPGRLKDIANFLLIVMMGFSVWTHYTIKDPFEKMAPALVFGSLLVCRLIIAFQVEKRDQLETENRILRDLYEESKANEDREKKE
jgi:hypothetical protein